MQYSKSIKVSTVDDILKFSGIHEKSIISRLETRPTIS